MSSPRRLPPPERTAAAAGALVVALVLYLLLPGGFHPAVRLGVTAVEVIALVVLATANPTRLTSPVAWWRPVALVQAGVLVAAGLGALADLVAGFVSATPDQAPRLVVAAAQIFMIEVVAFALVFWEIDRDGPIARRRLTDRRRHRPDVHLRNDDHAAPFAGYLRFALVGGLAFRSGTASAARPLSTRARLLVGLHTFANYVLIAVVVLRVIALR